MQNEASRVVYLEDSTSVMSLFELDAARLQFVADDMSHCYFYQMWMAWKRRRT
jgi:hypothetical protein